MCRDNARTITSLPVSPSSSPLRYAPAHKSCFYSPPHPAYQFVGQSGYNFGDFSGSALRTSPRYTHDPWLESSQLKVQTPGTSPRTRPIWDLVNSNRINIFFPYIQNANEMKGNLNFPSRLEQSDLYFLIEGYLKWEYSGQGDFCWSGKMEMLGHLIFVTISCWLLYIGKVVTAFVTLTLLYSIHHVRNTITCHQLNRLNRSCNTIAFLPTDSEGRVSCS